MTDQDTVLDPQADNAEGHDHEHDEAHEHDEGDAAAELTAKLKESIVVAQEPLGSLRVKLTVTVPRETLDLHLAKEYGDLQRDSVIPGFRKGRAPRKLVEKRFADEVGTQLLTKLLSTSYMAAVEKEALDPIGDPLIWAKVKEQKTDDAGVTRTVETEKLVTVEQSVDALALPDTGDFSYSCEIELKPKFELPELENIPVKRPKIEITDAMIGAEMTNLCAARGTFQPVEGGTIQEHDLLYADMTMMVDGVEIAKEANIDVAARPTWVYGVPLKELGTAVVGKKVGDTVTCEGVVPDDHENGDIRGKTAVFSFVIHEVKRLSVPPLDADMLASFGVDNEDALRARVRDVMAARRDERVAEYLREQVIEHLVKNTPMEIPEGLSSRQAQRGFSRRMMQMLRQNVPQAEIEKHLDEIRLKASEDAAHDLRRMFLLDKAAETLEVDVSEEEINGAIAEIARYQNKRFDRVRDELSKDNGTINLYLRLRDEKVLDRIIQDAEISEE